MHEVAGIAGVEPWGYSIRDLVRRARAVRLEEWDKVAAIRAQIYAIHLALAGKRSNISIADFNPYRNEGSTLSIIESRSGGMTPLKRMAEIMKAGAYLPKKLTEEQKAAIWERLIEHSRERAAKRDALAHMRGEIDDA